MYGLPHTHRDMTEHLWSFKNILLIQIIIINEFILSIPQLSLTI